MASTHKYDVGYTQTNRQGLTYTVIAYRDRKDIDVQFEDGLIVEHIPVTRLNQNTLSHPNYPIVALERTPQELRLGEVKLNNQGQKMTVITYRTDNDIDVQFENGFIVDHTQYQLFERGTITDPFFPSVCGVGYMGMKTKYGDSKKYAKEYEVWVGMMKRCYNENYGRHPWYEGYIVANEWHSFANFLKWYQNIIMNYQTEWDELSLIKTLKLKSAVFMDRILACSYHKESMEQNQKLVLLIGNFQLE